MAPNPFEKIILSMICKHESIPLSELFEEFNEHLFRGETVCTDFDSIGKLLVYCRSILTYLEYLMAKNVVKYERGWITLLDRSICKNL